jgi:hypothetical protein
VLKFWVLDSKFDFFLNPPIALLVLDMPSFLLVVLVPDAVPRVPGVRSKKVFLV